MNTILCFHAKSFSLYWICPFKIFIFYINPKPCHSLPHSYIPFQFPNPHSPFPQILPLLLNFLPESHSGDPSPVWVFPPKPWWFCSVRVLLLPFWDLNPLLLPRNCNLRCFLTSPKMLSPCPPGPFMFPALLNGGDSSILFCNDFNETCVILFDVQI